MDFIPYLVYLHDDDKKYVIDQESACTWAVVLVGVDACFLRMRQRNDLLGDDLNARLLIGELQRQTTTTNDTARRRELWQYSRETR